METTVKIDFNGDILSAVVFGSIDYAVDEKICFDIVGDSILIFDAVNKESFALGSVEVLEVGKRDPEEDVKVELLAEGSNPNANVDESNKGFFKKIIHKVFKKKPKEEAQPEKQPAEEEKE